MAKKREKIKLKSSESTHCYWTSKNPRNSTERLQLNKYDPVVKKHVSYKEAK
ncbi:MAG: 50S ribosomal protein L33 [Parachlamydiales bacterium]|nr:50S ribosomal protein L33 [Parachlamydiales bacterium]